MNEDKQDKIISLLSQITKQNQTEIDNQKHLINNQVGLSSVIMNAQNTIVKGLNGVMQCINGLSANNSATNQHIKENGGQANNQSKITDRLDEIVQTINRNGSAIRQYIKDNSNRITAQSVNDTKDILTQLHTNGGQIKLNGSHVYDDFATINVISRMIPDLLYLGSDIYASVNSVARKQGAFFYTNCGTPGIYRDDGRKYTKLLNQHKYYTGDTNDDK